MQAELSKCAEPCSHASVRNKDSNTHACCAPSACTPRGTEQQMHVESCVAARQRIRVWDMRDN